MTLASGLKLGPYEIISPLGKGGMGEVYRANDTRLDRTVAVKVLPSTLSADPAFRQRFEREARTISSLSHPNICALHDVGHQDGIDFLVMEFLEGETLADRLSKGPLSTEQALQYGIQIADALDKAHKKGIVHRDLKPGNIMLTKSGTKLLDFGLAKLNTVPNASPSVSALATEEKELTKEGTILGTIQYMAPEQLESKPTDSRTDIFAFGEVLYEMVTGKKAFTGSSQASLIAAILDKEPKPISEVQPMTPPVLDRVVRTCLAKDPDDRWQSAHDVMSELKWIAEAGSQAGVAAPVISKSKWRERVAWILVGLLLMTLAASIFTAYSLYQSQRKIEPIRSYILAPEGNTLNFLDANSGSLTLSPDGRWITFAASNSSAKTLLWLRPLNSLESRPIIGSEDGVYPFWSPDSRYVAFFSDGKLKKANISGGPTVIICDAGEGRGGTWNQQGVILFAPNTGTPIHRVSAEGGESAPITKINKANKEQSHRYPYFLPNGKQFLYVAMSHTSPAIDAIHAASIDGQKDQIIAKGGSNVVYSDGFLLFVQERVLMAQQFDLRSLTLKGSRISTTDQVNFAYGWRSASFSASNQGLLVYAKGSGNDSTRLTWFNRKGEIVGTVGEPAPYDEVCLSPDGKRAIVSIKDTNFGTADLWLYDLTREIRTRLTFNPAREFETRWSYDGRKIAFVTDRNDGGFDIYQVQSDGGQEKPFIQTAASEQSAGGWSRDGRYFSYVIEDATENNFDIWILPEFGDRKPFPFLETQYNEVNGVFSPDGKWIAYESNESGIYEIYVVPFPRGSGKWQISKNGGVSPNWRKDGKEIIYQTSDNSKLMSVEVNTDQGFEIGIPIALFQISRSGPGAISADGQRFLIAIPDKAVDEQPITLITNWTTILVQD